MAPTASLVLAEAPAAAGKASSIRTVPGARRARPVVDLRKLPSLRESRGRASRDWPRFSPPYTVRLLGIEDAKHPALMRRVMQFSQALLAIHGPFFAERDQIEVLKACIGYLMNPRTRALGIFAGQELLRMVSGFLAETMGVTFFTMHLPY